MKRILALPFLLVAVAAPVRYRMFADAPVLVSTSWLADHVRDDKLVILHVGNDASFTTAHIPGARLMTLATFGPDRDGLTTQMPEAAAFQQLLEAAGVSNDTRIIVYSATNPPTLAARLYVTLDHFGLSARTSLLDGGLKSWQTENRAIATGAAPAVTHGSVMLKARTDIVADRDFVSAHLTDRGTAILDARDVRYYTGEALNQQRAARAGRVPGAKNIPFSTVVDASGLLLGRDSLTTLFARVGVEPGRAVVTYCHVGQQASLLFVAARVLGLDARIYDGSYEDWSRTLTLRVDSGGPSQPTPITVLRFSAVIDASGRSITDGTIIVQADTIISVGLARGPIPVGARVVDLRPLTAIPGMIDVHTHMTYWRDKSRPTGQGAPRSKDSVVMAAAENARHTLETGVTTVRDLGASNYTDIAMRDSINKGVMLGPRMFVAGYGMSKSTRAPTPGAASGAARGQVRDTAEIREAVKAQVDAGADWIKMYGSTGSFQNVTGRQTFTDDEMRVAVDAAHKLGKPIAIHSYGDSGGVAAMRAGAESVEHPAGVSDAMLKEWAKSRTVYVPTVDHNRFYAENASLLGYTAQQVASLDSFVKLNLETVRRANAAGVKIAMGSDAVYWMFGENTRELGWMVKAGMTPAQALATATTIPAELLRLPKKLGSLAPGFFADIVGVEGDPLKDIDVVISHVRWVMKGGAVVVDKRTPR